MRGRRHLRIALADVLAGCHSAPECELRDLVERSRVLPEPHTPLPDLPDVSPDGWWEEARLVLEVDSVEHHSLGPDADQTQRRQARIAAAGWPVLPIGPRRIRREPVPLLREIEAGYRAGLLSRQPW